MVGVGCDVLVDCGRLETNPPDDIELADPMEAPPVTPEAPPVTPKPR